MDLKFINQIKFEAFCIYDIRSVSLVLVRQDYSLILIQKTATLLKMSIVRWPLKNLHTAVQSIKASFLIQKTVGSSSTVHMAFLTSKTALQICISILNWKFVTGLIPQDVKVNVFCSISIKYLFMFYLHTCNIIA